MTEPAYFAVDWGTSSFRLWLVDRAGQHNVAERRRLFLDRIRIGAVKAQLYADAACLGARDDADI